MSCGETACGANGLHGDTIFHLRFSGIFVRYVRIVVADSSAFGRFEPRGTWTGNDDGHLDFAFAVSLRFQFLARPYPLVSAA